VAAPSPPSQASQPTLRNFQFALLGQRNARTTNAPANALQARSNPSCDDDAISESDMGKVKIMKIHTAAPPAQAIAAAPTATAAIPVITRDTSSVSTTVIFAIRPTKTPIAEGA
jgi:hypothetical protein